MKKPCPKLVATLRRHREQILDELQAEYDLVRELVIGELNLPIADERKGD